MVGIPHDIPKFTPVLVEYEDICHEGAPVNSTEFISEYVPALRKILGWLLHYNDERVFVAFSNDKITPAAEDTDVQAVDVIPRGVITHFEILPSKAPAKKRVSRKKAAR